MIGPVTRGFSRLIARFEKRDEREFLPAALEVLQTPPSPVARLLGGSIIAFFVIATAWACFGKVDILATAPGRLLPRGEVKVIQSLDPGVVTAIHVQNGDRVKAGQVLVELDPTDTTADRDSLEHDLMQAQLDVARLTALKRTALTGRGPAPFVAPPGAAPGDIAAARAALASQADTQFARLASIDQQISQKRAEADEVVSQTAKLKAVLPMLEEKQRVHAQLRAKGFGTTLAYLDAEQQLTSTQHDLMGQADRAAQARAARIALERQRDQTVSQFASAVLDELAKAEQRQSEGRQALVKARLKVTNTRLRSPIDGGVEALAVNTVGGVVTPAQRLMTIVPDNRQLVVEAQLENRDVGFVRAGQRAEVKVETFNFTRYGVVPGRVLSVSRDAVVDAPLPDQRAPAGSPRYIARIALDAGSLMVDGSREPLQPGMAVTAEIKTGQRTIIDYLLSPIARRTRESLHER